MCGLPKRLDAAAKNSTRLEDHGEDGVAVSRWLNGLASPDPGKYNAVGPTPYERQADAFHLPWVRTRKDRRGTMKAYGTAVALSSTPA